MKLWVARDKDGALFLFSGKPTLEKDYWYNDKEMCGCFADIPNYYFPEVTFENSPQEVELKLV